MSGLQESRAGAGARSQLGVKTRHKPSQRGDFPRDKQPRRWGAEKGRGWERAGVDWASCSRLQGLGNIPGALAVVHTQSVQKLPLGDLQLLRGPSCRARGSLLLLLTARGSAALSPSTPLLVVFAQLGKVRRRTLRFGALLGACPVFSAGPRDSGRAASPGSDLPSQRRCLHSPQ